jgi:hypothetical protein
VQIATGNSDSLFGSDYPCSDWTQKASFALKTSPWLIAILPANSLKAPPAAQNLDLVGDYVNGESARHPQMLDILQFVEIACVDLSRQRN